MQCDCSTWIRHLGLGRAKNRIKEGNVGSAAIRIRYAWSNVVGKPPTEERASRVKNVIFDDWPAG